MEGVIELVRLFIIFFTIRIFLNSIFKGVIIRKQVYNQKSVNDLEDSRRFSEEDISKGAVDMVYDQVCQLYLPKTKAYQVVEEEETRYFCSWECRQHYIETRDIKN